MSERQFKIGVAVNTFLIKDNKVLLGKRLKKVGYGQWALPGGHLEYKESLVDGAKRELQEETGLEAVKLEFLQLINGIDENTHFIHINFLVSEWSGELINKEPNKCEKWEWFDLNKLPDNLFYGHKDSFRAYKQGVHFMS